MFILKNNYYLHILLILKYQIMTMKYLKIDNSVFKKNRKAFMSKIKNKEIAIFNSNDRMPTNADGMFPFKQNSDFFWLSGIDQEESILLLFPFSKSTGVKEILFVKRSNDHIATWEGAKLNKSEAEDVSGIKTIFWLDEFDVVLKKILTECDKVFLNKNSHKRLSSPVETRDDRFRKKFKQKNPNKKILESAPIMHDLRSIKSKAEISLIQNACNITEKGFRRILPLIKPGIMEYEIEAELIHEFIRNRSRGFAYEPIIGSGKNSCILHYTDNNQLCNENDILLMDFGAEYANYASDLTRCVPVNGVFSKRQKNVYNSVLLVMKEAIKMLRAGTTFKDYNKEVGLIMENELIKLKLLNKHDVLKQDKKFPLYKKYFMHGTSHHLGLDVHDVGNFNGKMREGMVFTCEPGIYIPNEKLGVRLENDILVTEDGPVDLMKNIPIDTDEIEDLMQK